MNWSLKCQFERLQVNQKAVDTSCCTPQPMTDGLFMTAEVRGQTPVIGNFKSYFSAKDKQKRRRPFLLKKDVQCKISIKPRGRD